LTHQVLTDAQWKVIEPFCLGKKSDPGQTGGDVQVAASDRKFLWKNPKKQRYRNALL